MAYYRLYTVGIDGRFREVAVTDAGTDVEACEIAIDRLDGQRTTIEVWQETRRVAVVTRDGVQMVEPISSNGGSPDPLPH